MINSQFNNLPIRDQNHPRQEEIRVVIFHSAHFSVCFPAITTGKHIEVTLISLT